MHAINPSTWVVEAGWSLEFKANLIYRASYRTVGKHKNSLRSLSCLHLWEAALRWSCFLVKDKARFDSLHCRTERNFSAGHVITHTHNFNLIKEAETGGALWSFVVVLFLKQQGFLSVTDLAVLELAFHTRLRLRSTCLYFLSAGIKGVCHHAPWALTFEANQIYWRSFQPVRPTQCDLVLKDKNRKTEISCNNLKASISCCYIQIKIIFYNLHIQNLCHYMAYMTLK